MRIPDNLDFEQAASIPEVFLTAYDAMFRQCELAMGESVLSATGTNNKNFCIKG